MNLFKKYKGQFLLTFLLLAVILTAPFQDYTERIFQVDSIHYPEDAAISVSPEAGVLTVPENAGSILFHTDPLYLKKGTYQVTFNIASPGEGNRVEARDPLHVNPDNTTGKTLAGTFLSSAEESVTLSFTIEDYTECVQFCVISEAPLEFRSIYLLSQTGLYKDPYIYAGLLLLSSAVLLLYRTRRKLRPEALVLLGFAAVWSSLPFGMSWLMNGHDMFFHYGRLYNLAAGLSDGFFPVRFHPDMFRGFGYMSSVFYPEFFLYPFALPALLGMSPIGCYRLLMLGVNFATAGTAYYAFSHLLRSRRLGLIAAFFYTLSGYRLINLYTRAAVGEVIAMIFIPLLFLGMYRLLLGDSRKWMTSVLAFTGLFQSHLISTELAVVFCLFFTLWNIRRLKEGKRLLHLLLAAFSTLLLNLWFLLPLLDHMRYDLMILEDTRDLANYALHPAQIFDTGLNNPAGLALGKDKWIGEMPHSIGLVLLIGILLFLFVCFRRQRKSFPLQMGKWCLGLGLFSVYASSVYFPWDALRKIEPLYRAAEKIQFPSRFLPFATAFLCITTAVGISEFFKVREQRQLLFLLCAVLAVYTAGNYFSDFSNETETFVNWNNQLDHAQDTDTLYLVTDGGKYFSIARMLVQETAFSPSEGVTLSDCFRERSDAGFTYTQSEGSADTYVDVPFNFYPGFHAYDSSGNRLETAHGELNRLRVLLPENSGGSVEIRMEFPGFYKAGDIISFLTAILLLLTVLIPCFRRKS